MDEAKSRDDQPHRLVEDDVLVDGQEPGHTGGADVSQRLPQHQDQNQGAVEIQTLATAAGW